MSINSPDADSGGPTIKFTVKELFIQIKTDVAKVLDNQAALEDRVSLLEQVEKIRSTASNNRNSNTKFNLAIIVALLEALYISFEIAHQTGIIH